jgi:hypothetical protein
MRLQIEGDKNKDPVNNTESGEQPQDRNYEGNSAPDTLLGSLGFYGKAGPKYSGKSDSVQ